GRRELARAASPAPRGDHLWLGIRHILSGPDHLLFVAGLVALVGRRRRLVATITAFTAGHSLTLAAIAAGWFHPAALPVEILVAASLLFLARALAAPGASE